jgi:hypothetical protein
LRLGFKGDRRDGKVVQVERRDDIGGRGRVLGVIRRDLGLGRAGFGRLLALGLGRGVVDRRALSFGANRARRRGPVRSSARRPAKPDPPPTAAMDHESEAPVVATCDTDTVVITPEEESRMLAEDIGDGAVTPTIRPR